MARPRRIENLADLRLLPARPIGNVLLLRPGIVDPEHVVPMTAPCSSTMIVPRGGAAREGGSVLVHVGRQVGQPLTDGLQPAGREGRLRVLSRATEKGEPLRAQRCARAGVGLDGWGSPATTRGSSNAAPPRSSAYPTR